MKIDEGGVELYSPALLKKDQVGISYLNLPHTGIQEIEYDIVDGLCIYQGDIVLGTVEDLKTRNQEFQSQSKSSGTAIEINRAVGATHSLWPNATVYYTIDPSLPNQNRVTDAIAHWETHTIIKFVARTTEANYVNFAPGSGCSSYVGMKGGVQNITLGPKCTTGNAIHEIGHAVGLWHEQSRADRDFFLDIELTNVIPGKEFNFNKHVADGQDIGVFDYGSIMEYGAYAFSDNGQKTIVTKNGASIGQRLALSPLDIAGVDFIYKMDNIDPITDITVIAGSSSSIQPPAGYTKVPQDLNEGSGGKFVYVCYKTEPTTTNYITDVIAISGSSSSIQPPAGYTKINQDCNAGSGGKYVYICYKSEATGIKLTNLSAIASNSTDIFPTPGSGYVRVNQDLNAGSGGKFIYLIYQPDPYASISNVTVIQGSSSSIAAPAGYVKVNVDLNEGAGGQFIYVCYNKTTDVPVTGLTVITGSKSTIQPPAGFTKINKDLNAGAGGKFIYLCYQDTVGSPIDGITVITGSSSSVQPPSGYTKIDTDLNSGAGGKFIYLCYRGN